MLVALRNSVGLERHFSFHSKQYKKACLLESSEGPFSVNARGIQSEQFEIQWLKC